MFSNDQASFPLQSTPQQPSPITTPTPPATIRHEPTLTETDGRMPTKPDTDRQYPTTPDSDGYRPTTTDNDGHVPPLADADRQSPPLTDEGGQRPTMTDTVGHSPTPPDTDIQFNLDQILNRTERHTLTIQEVMRRFREAGIPRSERTILRWCQPDQFGGRRLDGVKDMNDGRYYITPESVDDVTKEEQAKEARDDRDNYGATTAAPTQRQKTNADNGRTSNTASHDGFNSDVNGDDEGSPSMSDGKARKLQMKIRDLEITNAAKDHVIDRYETERDKFVDQLMASSRQVGELEQKLLQLEAPNAHGRNEREV
ncbi:MAG: hypothetical protein ACI9R3_004410 [Verrucomicrobiales bacterium]|jgi:hypothetical protein